MTVNQGTVENEQQIIDASGDYADVEIIFAGWGAPRLEGALLEALPSLKAVFYGAGAVKQLVSQAFWNRRIKLTSAYKANAVPVAEYTLASIVFALKKTWQINADIRKGQDSKVEILGVYHGSTVGIISLGAIGQLVCQKLKEFDLSVIAYDPFASSDTFSELCVRQSPTLEALFKESGVVSLHAPWLAETEGMITGDLLRSMPDGATFINTSRGAIVDEPAMLKVLQERKDLFAVIDVITDESAYFSTALGKLPNVFMTPHIAGSKGRECHRMGSMAVEECRRHLDGKPALTEITEETIVIMA